MSQSKIQSLLPMPLGEKWLFDLHHRLHTSIFQVVASCLGCERLVGYLLKNLSDLGTILSLPGSDKMLGIVGICFRKLGRTSTNGLLLIGTVFSAKPGDGTNMQTSRG